VLGFLLNEWLDDELGADTGTIRKANFFGKDAHASSRVFGEEHGAVHIHIVK